MRKPDDAGLNSHKPTHAQHRRAEDNALRAGDLPGGVAELGDAKGLLQQQAEGELFADGADEPDGICGSEVSAVAGGGVVGGLGRFC